MNIHEYQAKELFAGYGVPVPRGVVAFSPDEAFFAAKQLATTPVVVKAQIHAGGRGKAGGVKLAHSPEEARDLAQSMLGAKLVTRQTMPSGKTVHKLLVEEGLPIDRELYFSIIPDRATAKIVIMASTEGGMDIEEVAEKTPEKIVRVSVDPLLGIMPHHCRRAAFALNLPSRAFKPFTKMVSDLYRLFVEKDCSLVEINPLVLTTDERVLALDAKINFDDNALFRHKDIAGLSDPEEEDPLEVEASAHNLNYIKMDGNVGNMVNGAGLAMATMDIIKQAGAEPANFLDVGGGANAETVENGFRIILSDKNVKGILINIFGGILRCDVLASGVVKAAKKVGLNVPVVVRMEGTNVEEGRRILAESGLNLINAKDLTDAAKKVSEIVN
ncbi:MAG: ADP-forming succinate--CoA ligase subunit beta [Deltaproteobacteria bacterium]|nr:ADP-forming succinate--CoA ligase subunit beta [Deltaproteobacteria bacterium]